MSSEETTIIIDPLTAEVVNLLFSEEEPDDTYTEVENLLLGIETIRQFAAAHNYDPQQMAEVLKPYTYEHVASTLDEEFNALADIEKTRIKKDSQGRMGYYAFRTKTLSPWICAAEDQSCINTKTLSLEARAALGKTDRDFLIALTSEMVYDLLYNTDEHIAFEDPFSSCEFGYSLDDIYSSEWFSSSIAVKFYKNNREAILQHNTEYEIKETENGFALVIDLMQQGLSNQQILESVAELNATAEAEREQASAKYAPRP